MPPDLSIVIPCRNEQARLPGTLDALAEYLDRSPGRAEIVIVVERGTDDTAGLARAREAKDPRFVAVCNEVARGKGYAVRVGMLRATGRVVFFMDADLSVPLRFIDLFLESFADGADVVFGSRQHPGSRILRSQPLRRVLAGRAFNACLRLAGATRFKDTQCGFKAFRQDAARQIFSRAACNGFGFDVEALALADALGFRIVERPVDWSDAPGSKVRALRDGTAAFLEALGGAYRARRAARAIHRGA